MRIWLGGSGIGYVSVVLFIGPPSVTIIIGTWFGGSLSIVYIISQSLFSLWGAASFCREVNGWKQLMHS